MTKTKNQLMDVKEEILVKKMKKRCILHPNSTFHQVWDAGATVALVLTCLITPYQLAFYSHMSSEPESLETLNQVIDMIFLADIMISFNTSYFDLKNNAFSIVRKDIACNYIKTWFAIDIIAIFPFEQVLYFIYAGS